MPETNPPDNLPMGSKAPEEAPLQEFFKREEIKTMARDVAELREAEAKEEKERISSFKPNPVKREEIKYEARTPSPVQRPAPIIPPALKQERPIPPAPIIPPAPPLPRQSPTPIPPAPSTVQPPVTSIPLVSKPDRPIPPTPIMPSVPSVPRQSPPPFLPARPIPPVPPAPPLPRRSPTLPSEALAKEDKGSQPPFSRLFKKIIIRGLVIFLCLSVLGFGFWLWQGKKPATPEEPAATETPTATSTQEVPPTGETTQIPTIQERLVTLGFRNVATRIIDTIILHSNYNASGGDPYDIEKVIEGHQANNTANHYLIDRNGAIYRLVLDKNIAYQAGTGIMPDGSRKNIINNFSLGVQLIYAKTESPNEAQYQSLAKLVNYLKQQYNIPSKNILANNQINPGRKDDPWNFDWEKFNSLIK